VTIEAIGATLTQRIKAWITSFPQLQSILPEALYLYLLLPSC